MKLIGFITQYEYWREGFDRCWEDNQMLSLHTASIFTLGAYVNKKSCNDVD